MIQENKTLYTKVYLLNQHLTQITAFRETMNEGLQETKAELSNIHNLKKVKVTTQSTDDWRHQDTDQRRRTDDRKVNRHSRSQHPRERYSPELPLHSEYEARPYRNIPPPNQPPCQADTNPKRTKRTEDVEQLSRRLDGQRMELQFQPEWRAQTTAPNRSESE